MATNELTPEPDADGSFAADPDNHWGLPERTAQDAPEPTQDEKRRLRAQAAVMLKIRGADYGEIAQVLDYANAASARNAVERTLAEVAEHDGPGAWATQRNLARMRYEGLLAEVFPIATDKTDEGFFQAQRQAALLIDRITVLDGLNMPTRHVIYSPQATEFDELLRQTLEASGITEPHEGDIFELAVPLPLEEAKPGELDEDQESEEVIEDAEVVD